MKENEKKNLVVSMLYEQVKAGHAFTAELVKTTFHAVSVFIKEIEDRKWVEKTHCEKCKQKIKLYDMQGTPKQFRAECDCTAVVAGSEKEALEKYEDAINA